MIYTYNINGFQQLTINQIIEKLNLELISLDIETSGLNPWTDELLLLTLGNSNFQIVINCKNCEGIKAVINSVKAKKIIIHNSKFDIKFIKQKYNIELRNVYCTMLASQILNNGLGIKNDLKSVCKRLLDIDIDKKMQALFINKPSNALFSKSEVEYAAKDISVLEPLYYAQKPFIEQYNLSYLVNLENKITPIIVNIELKGIDLDTDKWLSILNENLVHQKELIFLMDEEILKLSKDHISLQGLIKHRITQKSTQFDIFGGKQEINNEDLSINYNSHLQIKNIFTKINEHLESTSEEFLKKIRRKRKSKLLNFVDLLLKYREISTEINVFGEKFLKYINKETDKIHTSFTQMTKSGRFTSGDEKNDDGKIIYVWNYY